MKKIISIFTLLTLLLGYLLVPVSYAFEMPSAPSAPSAPTPPPEPSAPPSTQNPPSAPTPPPAPNTPTLQDLTSPTPTPQPSNTPEPSPTASNGSNGGGGGSSTGGSSASLQPSPSPSPSIPPGNQTGFQNSSGYVNGDPSIITGTATNNAGVSTVGNNNLSATPTGDNGSVTVKNDGNGQNSTNNGSVSIVGDDQTFQNNSARVSNGLTQTTVSGQNTTSGNIGDSSIQTGDANTTGTVITAVNTNIDGVQVAEFNVVDDHRGDLVLDFGSACISGCGGSSAAAVNSGNGQDSTNTASIDQTTNNLTFQNNQAVVGSDLVLSADSGNNSASGNTGGDSFIKTGDANVAANVLTFANNNLAGNVVYGVVNIFGNLIGDIILPDSEVQSSGSACTSSCGQNNTLVGNIGNGDGSTNDAVVNLTENTSDFQFNNADIENNLILNASTGSNQSSGNTGGDSMVQTGNTSLDAKVLNVANSNVDGGNWWLVIVNEAGRWIGKLIGAPDGSNMAGSVGTEFIVGENGEITAVNSGNGQNSTNNSSVSQTTNNLLVQTNDAKVANNLNLSANTGSNQSSANTGGDSFIKTGDANIVANLINFVNNNVSGGGKLVVTVVNVFGSWVGDFITPGHKKEDQAQASVNPPQGGTDPQGSTGGNSGGGNSGNSTGSSGGSTSSFKAVVSSVTTHFQAPQNSSSEESSGITTQVAGVKIENPLGAFVTSALTAGDTAKGTIKINLAWVLLLLPLVLGAVIIKNLISFFKRTFRNKVS
ncbi:hypothetical protein HYS93_02670 [Candidatus Daviesbacteria bacterium]|nr:hypothetical protein [Candidatus Daviesbacteria bacterium]